MIVCFILLLVAFPINTLDLSVETLGEIFGSKVCVPGSLSSMQFTSTDTMHDELKVKTEVISNMTGVKVDASNSLTNLNELAQFNGLKYFYKLEKEEGPPHEKTFTLSLTLGDESYEGKGRSLKKAKQNVAAIALLNTKYESPPVKEKNIDSGSQTPMALLNDLSTKLGIPVTYELVDKERQVLSDAPSDQSTRTKKSYFQKLNDSLDSSGLHVKKDLPQDKGPFQIKLTMLDKFFYGFAHTIKAAKHDAASKAIDYLIQNKDQLNTPCQKEGMEEQCKQAKQSMKSPISRIYEEAQMRKIGVEFEIIDESGPAHKRNFVTQCILGDLTVTGEGHSKKDSKRSAAQNMLERLPELPPVSQKAHVDSMMKDKKKKKKKNKIIKTKLDEIAMMAGDIIDSVLGKSNDGNRKASDTGDSTDDAKKPRKPGNAKHSYQREILELSNSLNFEVQFKDFWEKNKQHSVLSLLINPEYICYGEGLDQKMARERASLGALKVLYKLGLHNKFEELKYTMSDKEFDLDIGILVKEDVREEKDEL